MRKFTPEKLRIYFDGKCYLCSAEISHYRNHPEGQAFTYVDITHPQFDAKAESLDPFAVHRVMHVKLENGQLVTAVDAFLNIWKNMPSYHPLYRIASLKALRPLLDLGYHSFARIRPYLPQKKQGLCSDSPYCELRKPI